MIKQRIACLLLILAPLTTMAQDISATVPIPALVQKDGNLFHMASESAKGKPVLLQPLYWVKTLIDSSAVATIDRNYIEQPKPAWAIEARGTLNQSTLKMETTWEDPVEGNTNLWAKSKNGLSTSAGLWLGYRGYGFGYSKEFGQKVRTLFLDGYYMLNGKHFSYAAAYDNSLIQKRSAGSIVVGGMYCHSRADYSADSNWLLTALMEGVGKVTFSQGSIGAGYAYNWVPARGWLVSAMAMPMLTFYNRTTEYMYDFDFVNPNVKDWEALSEDEVLEWVFDQDTKIVKVDERKETSNNKVKLNFDARLSVVYNFDRWYLRVYGHYNQFRYGNDFVSGRVTDWTANASLGFRF